MHRLLPLLILALLVITAFTYIPVKREIVYRLGISGDPTTSCCGDPELIAQSDGNFDESATVAVFNNEVIDYPKSSLAANFELIQGMSNDSNVLGTTTAADGSEKWIEVSLNQQKVRAWEGDKIVMEFLISSGKWYPTPKGTFYIWYKTRAQTMKGGSKELGTYYNLPNVTHNMFFHKGYALHGAYWHNNFGHPMSHGCVNEPLDKADAIFDWAGPVVPPGVNAIRSSDANPGTKVFIH